MVEVVLSGGQGKAWVSVCFLGSFGGKGRRGQAGARHMDFLRCASGQTEKEPRRINKGRMIGHEF